MEGVHRTGHQTKQLFPGRCHLACISRNVPFPAQYASFPSHMLFFFSSIFMNFLMLQLRHYWYQDHIDPPPTHEIPSSLPY